MHALPKRIALVAWSSLAAGKATLTENAAPKSKSKRNIELGSSYVAIGGRRARKDQSAGTWCDSGTW